MGGSAHSGLKENFFFLPLEFTCDATLVEKGFETGKRRVDPAFARFGEAMNPQ